MKKATGGEGWAFIPEEKPKSTQTDNERSPIPKIRLEKRAGKKVTVITGLHTYGDDRLTTIARELKTMCGAGGTVKNGSIEIQGDKTALVQEWFTKQGLKI